MDDIHDYRDKIYNWPKGYQQECKLETQKIIFQLMNMQIALLQNDQLNSKECPVSLLSSNLK